MTNVLDEKASMDLTILECRRTLDVRASDTNERIGFLIDTGEKPTPWIVVAILPRDGRNQFLGAFKKPKQAVAALIANETALVDDSS
jgi:hypothetical protein